MRTLTTSRNQSGITAIGMMVILGLIAFFTMITLRLAPIYIENLSVISSLNSLQEDVGLVNERDSAIKTKLMKRLRINDVKHVKSSDIHITGDSQSINVDVEYEVRSPMAFNIEVLLTFSNNVVVRAH